LSIIGDIVKNDIQTSDNEDIRQQWLIEHGILTQLFECMKLATSDKSAFNEPIWKKPIWENFAIYGSSLNIINCLSDSPH
ncbi:hypothetical protein PMAYCL1PPCAC_03535, partial [Pristionchus mayeri]